MELTPDEEVEVCCLADDGRSFEWIAEWIGCTRNQVRRCLAKHRRLLGANKSELTQAKARRVVASYLRGAALRHIARAEGLGQATVRKVLEDRQVEIRRRGRPATADAQ